MRSSILCRLAHTAALRGGGGAVDSDVIRVLQLVLLSIAGIHARRSIRQRTAHPTTSTSSVGAEFFSAQRANAERGARGIQRRRSANVAHYFFSNGEVQKCGGRHRGAA